MKFNKNYVAVMAVLGMGLGMVGCDDDDSDSTDADVSDASVDSSNVDAVVMLDGNTTDGGSNADKDGATGDASSDATGGTASDAGGDAAPLAISCSNYCDTVVTNCTGGNAQYTNKGDCISACQNKLAWPQGTDNTGNTVACRTYHAGLAASNATTHCPHAGPTGAGMCGTLCENYCYLASKNCVGGNALYQDNAACLTACTTSPGFATTGMVGDTTGNTLQCRVYHVNAARDDADLHCPHSGATPTALCVPAI